MSGVLSDNVGRAGGLVKAAGGGGFTQGTEQATTSGTAMSFTSIPAGTKMINMQMVGVSFSSGSTELCIQIGDSGGYETSSYLGRTSDHSGSMAALSNAFQMTNGGDGSHVYHGQAILTLEDSSDYTWTGFWVLGRSDGANGYIGAGSKSLSAELDRVQLTTTGGSNTFDAGVVNISYI